MDDAAQHPDLARYSRQMLFTPIGVAGQRRLKHANVTLVGCGALGSVLASTLVRAGVGALRLIDRDFIELNNLQRQMLFDEHDIAQNLPKAEAAARKLRKINSAVEIEAFVDDVNPGNIMALCGEADLLLDGTDNLETRYLINDLAVQNDIPWVYGACLAAEGLVLPILPHRTPCLRCIWEEPPLPGVTPTCDTVGVLAPVVSIVASLQAIAALKILTATEPASDTRLLAVDAWEGRIRSVNVQPAFDEGHCPCCKQSRYDFLVGGKTAATTTLCGRDAVQIIPPVSEENAPVNFRAIADRLPPRSSPKYNEFLLRFSVEKYAVTIFPDGRAIVQGTSDPTTARGVYAKYVGT
jgi:molybdopterin-synthase adenylyltransferase